MSGPEAALAGGVFGAEAAVDDDLVELRQLVEDIGRRAAADRVGRSRRPQQFDGDLWRNLEETGLARLTSTVDMGAGLPELAVVLHGLARHAGAVPVAETDLLAAWLGGQAALSLPGDGPLTVAVADATLRDGRISGTAHEVPWARAAAAIMVLATTPDGVYAGTIGATDCEIADGQNLAGEPSDRVVFDLPVDRFRPVDADFSTELVRRGAWARCVQVVGALDAAAESTVAHCRERVQFGRSLSKFQSVQHSLAGMAGEIERGRAAVTLAVAAAADHGFASSQADYAVTVAKVVLGRVTASTTTVAHQLHGAIGVSIEHPLWLSTMRARSWIGEFGSTGHYARRLGRLALATENPFDCLTGQRAGEALTIG